MFLRNKKSILLSLFGFLFSFALSADKRYAVLHIKGENYDYYFVIEEKDFNSSSFLQDMNKKLENENKDLLRKSIFEKGVEVYYFSIKEKGFFTFKKASSKKEVSFYSKKDIDAAVLNQLMVWWNNQKEYSTIFGSTDVYHFLYKEPEFGDEFLKVKLLDPTGAKQYIEFSIPSILKFKMKKVLFKMEKMLFTTIKLVLGFIIFALFFYLL